MAQVPFASVDPRTKHLRAQALYYQNIVEYLKQSDIVCDDFVLDLDLEETPEPSPVEPAYSAPAFLNRNRYKPSWQSSGVAVAEMPVATDDAMAKTQEWPSPVDTAPIVESSPAAVQAPTSAGSLSPEMIDAIARRVVEQLSEKVVQEIAWEVVPQLAELMIKRQLEEKSS